MNLDYPHVDSFETQESVLYSFKVKESDYVAGDIVLWDGEKKIVASQDGFSLPTSGYTPIGVVVIPASHMDDSRARMMSTRWMNCEDPENGSVEPVTMVCGTATDLSGLTNFGQVPIIAKYDDDNAGGKIELTSPQNIFMAERYAYLSSDFCGYEGETNPEDEGTRWRQSGTYWTTSGTVSAYNYYAPSPYTSEGTPNPLYRATSYSGGSINNALSYFDGRQQTDVILEARGEKDYESWKPTANTPADYPAASVCDMYHTVGTSQGDWYLPSQAELGYVVARLGNIVDAIAKVGGLLSLSSGWSLSSSCYTSDNARGVLFYNGRVDHWHPKETNLGSVVAFATV